MKVIQLIPLNDGLQDALDHTLALLRVELEEEAKERAAAADSMDHVLKLFSVQYKAMRKAAEKQNRFGFYMLVFQTSKLLLNSFIAHQFQKFAAA